MVSTSAPAARSAATVRPTDAPVRSGSKSPRSVSLMPTTTLATSGRSAVAAGSWTRSTSAASAPSVARLCRSGWGSVPASSPAQPSQPPPGAGSPMPTVIESPSAANRVIPLSPSSRCRPALRGRRGSRRWAVPQSYCSARARAAARRACSGRASTARTPAARSSPGTLAPASPTTSGSADSALTTTGVPQASASRAASPKVSAGPGAMATSALASSAASPARPGRKPAKVTGSPARAARRASRARSGPSPATTSRAGMPAARRVASVVSERCGFFSAESRPQCTSTTCPSPAYQVLTCPGPSTRGLNVSRSTPSGTRTRLAAPIRPNSAAAQLVVQMTRW